MARIGGVDDALAILRPVFAGRDRELLVVLLLSPTLRLKRSFQIEGRRSSALVPHQRIIRAIAAVHARAVVIAHNHPGGDATPSMDDLRVTRDLAQLCRAMGSVLMDHLVIAGDGFTSFRQLGLL
jgi:DNA repair protein RadC